MTTDIIVQGKVTKTVVITKTREIILPTRTRYSLYTTISEIVYDYTTTSYADVTETLTDSTVIVYAGEETIVEPQTTFYSPFTTSTTLVRRSLYFNTIHIEEWINQ